VYVTFLSDVLPDIPEVTGQVTMQVTGQVTLEGTGAS